MHGIINPNETPNKILSSLDCLLDPSPPSFCRAKGIKKKDYYQSESADREFILAR